jgi:hypothetical protein
METTLTTSLLQKSGLAAAISTFQTNRVRPGALFDHVELCYWCDLPVVTCTDGNCGRLNIEETNVTSVNSDYG